MDTIEVELGYSWCYSPNFTPEMIGKVYRNLIIEAIDILPDTPGAESDKVVYKVKIVLEPVDTQTSDKKIPE